MWNEAAVRYHHRRTGHPQARRVVSPVMNHLRGDHHYRDDRADDQEQIMR